ncbi:MAG: hypothetical protein U5L96_08430 [Owenweeksia sp.]|nr:hypothetical protein [Owenweeksia sp.]
MIWKQLFFHLHTFLLLIPGFGQPIHPQVIGELHKDLGECSGLAALPSGHFAQINDSGNPPCIFFTDTSGKLIDLECLPFAKNRDWEDLAYGDGYLFVGDFGNNRNTRMDLKIYRLGINERAFAVGGRRN